MSGVGRAIWHWASPAIEQREKQLIAAAAAVGCIPAVPEANQPDIIERPSRRCRLRFEFRPWGRRRWTPPLLRRRSVSASRPAKRANFKLFTSKLRESRSRAV